MPYQVSLYDDVLTVRFDGRCNAQDVYHDLRSALDKRAVPAIVVIDLTLATSFDQQLKSTLHRAMQHHNVRVVGICGLNATLRKDVDDLVPVLRRIRRVAIAETESDLHSQLGLAASIEQPKKLSGMLGYLKKP